MNQSGAGIRAAVDQWRLLDKKIETMELELTKLKDEKKGIEESTIPTLLEATGSVVYDDGAGVSIKMKTFTRGSIVSGLEVEAFEFLSNEGFDSIIKKTFEFGRGEDTGQLEEYLDASGMGYKKEVGVHHKSLEYAVNAILLQAEQLKPDITPAEVFPDAIKISQYSKAVISIKE